MKINVTDEPGQVGPDESSERYLIVNADDFGLHRAVNAGVIRAHEQGIVTSASLMVRHAAADHAAEYARAHSSLAVGLHVDLGEWRYVDGDWHPVYQVVRADDPVAVADEVSRQLESFRRLVGRNPTHLDSHQHVHRAEPVRSILLRTAHELGVNLRGTNSAIRYVGRFYGQSADGKSHPEWVSVEALLGLLREMPIGCSELGCHPGIGMDRGATYGGERELECATLCDERVRGAVAAERIVLIGAGCAPSRERAPNSDEDVSR